MKGGDRCLHRIGLRRSGRAQRLLDQRQALGDLLPVPKRAVLLFQEHDVPDSSLAAGAAGIMQQHQREQASDLAAAGHQRVEQPSQSDRLAREIRPHQVVAAGCDIALGEDEIDHGEHAVEPRRERLALRHFVGDAGEPDFLLGAQKALRHRLLAHQKRARHLRRGQSTHRTQGERDLDLRGK